MMIMTKNVTARIKTTMKATTNGVEDRAGLDEPGLDTVEEVEVTSFPVVGVGFPVDGLVAPALDDVDVDDVVGSVMGIVTVFLTVIGPI